MMDGAVVVTLIDTVIVFTVAECAALVAYHALTGKGVAPREFLANLISGLCLMLALRCLANDAASTWIAPCLLGAGVAHGADIVRRWKRSSRHAASAHEVIA